MDLWQIFVLAQVRMLLNTSYEDLHHIANNDHLIRQIMGVEKGFGYERYEFRYQNIVDNVSLLDDGTVRELNQVILEFGHEVFKNGIAWGPIEERLFVAGKYWPKLFEIELVPVVN
jgi:transposase, IS5 family